jgi:hypothetical protein
MRSKTLEAVLGEFEKWRARRRGRSAIPKELWRAAVDLVGRYSSTTICHRLRLNPGRFKGAREARGVAPGEGGVRRVRRRRRAGSRKRRSWSGRRFSVAPRRVALVPAAKEFVELPAPSVAGVAGVFPSPVVVMPRAGIRLTLESAAGTVTVSVATADPALADAVCQFVRGALGRSVGA